ncbi:hypothetical protein CUC53_08470 [Aeromonas cavernicola]|uniref:Uncharacterized protein n=1 Tax=Aeromonas cavernicola TaxID=1006623 RepID=A0A2H9U5C8_9GAMM|nr:hypothetical protein CUC53_08470 [Aeromonas cavernicola]
MGDVDYLDHLGGDVVAHQEVNERVGLLHMFGLGRVGMARLSIQSAAPSFGSLISRGDSHWMLTFSAIRTCGQQWAGKTATNSRPNRYTVPPYWVGFDVGQSIE